MDETQNTSPTQAPSTPPEPVPAAVQQPQTVPQPEPQPTQPSQTGRTFYKTFSPRLLNFPFSLAIDKNRARVSATKKGYQIPEPPICLSDGGMFWGNVYVEVKNADPADTSIVTLTDEQITAKEKV